MSACGRFFGATDGIVSTASLVLGVTAEQAKHSPILVAAIIGLVAGSVSMSVICARVTPFGVSGA